MATGQHDEQNLIEIIFPGDSRLSKIGDYS